MHVVLSYYFKNIASIKGKKVKDPHAYTSYDQQHITISQVAAEWHEVMHCNMDVHCLQWHADDLTILSLHTVDHKLVLISYDAE